MPNARTERRLIAILAADVAGYSRMIAVDENATLTRLSACLARLESRALRHGGRVIKTMGDGVLVEFASAAEALACAVEFQRQMSARKEPQTMKFRIGLNAGDAVITKGDVFGDVVNVAARLQALAPPGGICLTERVREDAQGRSHLAFEDWGDQRLKHIDRPVRVYCLHFEAESAATPQPLALPDKPSIAVLPFENLSGDAEQEYFADGVSEDVISALSRWRWFFVIARNSSFIYKGRAVDVTRVGRELGVRYVLEGSVRKAGGRVRVVAQLIDATDGRHIWSETFDRDLADVLALQDDITAHVVNAIEPAMMDSEGARAARKNIANLSAFDCFQRGVWHLNRLSREDFQTARALFEEAIRRDAELALGHAGLARILYGTVVQGWSDDPARDLAAAEAAARAAIQRDARDAWAHFALAGALLYLNRHEDALSAAQRAIALNPNFAFGHFRHGQVLLCMGRAAESIAPIARSIRHDPVDPQIGLMVAALSLAHYHARDYEAALARANESEHLMFAPCALVAAASLARLGRLDEARAALPDETVSAAIARQLLIPYVRKSDYDFFLEGLRLAGFRFALASSVEDLRAP